MSALNFRLGLIFLLLCRCSLEPAVGLPDLGAFTDASTMPACAPATPEMTRFVIGSGRIVSDYADCAAPASVGVLLYDIAAEGSCSDADCSFSPAICFGAWKGKLSVRVTEEKLGCLTTNGMDLAQECIFAFDGICPASHPKARYWTRSWTDSRSCACDTIDAAGGCHARETAGVLVQQHALSCCR